MDSLTGGLIETPDILIHCSYILGFTFYCVIIVNQLYCGFCDILSMFMDDKCHQLVRYQCVKCLKLIWYDVTKINQYWPVSLVISNLAIGWPWAGYWLYIDWLLVDYQLAISWLLAGYRLSISYLFAGYWLAISWLLTGYGWPSAVYQLSIRWPLVDHGRVMYWPWAGYGLAMGWAGYRLSIN